MKFVVTVPDEFVAYTRLQSPAREEYAADAMEQAVIYAFGTQAQGSVEIDASVEAPLTPVRVRVENNEQRDECCRIGALAKKHAADIGGVLIMKRFVVVTTEHRGVFGGYLNGDVSDDHKVLTLTDASMCLYWSQEVKGVLGLAVNGPLAGSRVGPPVASLTLTGVTAVMDASDAAEKLWLAQPW